ncbi:MAG TPA: energy transducer TonB [Steroidobacteraceae bacterium]|nr:energy transducer TonB [Steroidobacteraceae bacterium]
MAAYAQHDSTFFSRRAIAFVAIVLLHVLLIYGLASGLAHRVIEAVAPPIQTDIVQEVQKRDEPPPPPPPKLERPPVEVPPPDVTINVPVETNSTAITDVTNKHIVAPPPPPAPRQAVYTQVGMLKGFPNSDEFYPPASQRLDEEGTAQVEACVGPNGMLTQEPKIVKSSGHSRLDEGAIKLAKAGQGKYKPATEDGRPINKCFSFNVKFQLH